LQGAVAEARERSRQFKEEGVDQVALDAAASKGFGNALFEYDEDEMNQVVEEFYSPGANEGLQNSSEIMSKLREDLDARRFASG
jgi:hypothetical protein